MTKIHITKIPLALLFLLGSFPAVSQNIGEWKGYERINKIFSDRLLDQSEPKNAIFKIGKFVGASRKSTGLPQLLGSYSGHGVENEFRNAKPNGLNTTIWMMAFKNISQDMVRCETPHSRERGLYVLQQSLTDTLAQLCQNPSDPVFLEKLWIQVMGFDAPREEMRIWIDYFTKAPNSSSKERKVRSSLYAIFLNPYFLLNR